MGKGALAGMEVMEQKEMLNVIFDAYITHQLFPFYPPHGEF